MASFCSPSKTDPRRGLTCLFFGGLLRDDPNGSPNIAETSLRVWPGAFRVPENLRDDMLPAARMIGARLDVGTVTLPDTEDTSHHTGEIVIMGDAD